MKFAALATAALAAASANAAILDARQSTTDDCRASGRGLAYERPFVIPLVDSCRKAQKPPGNPWASRACVAAAVAAGPQVVRQQVSCEEPNIPNETKLPSLDYDIYASIVGKCAWAPGGCDVTRQNLVDLVYGEISARGGANPVWPDVNQLIRYYIDPIFRWTATDPGNAATHYLNFNDWLHYVGQVGHCTELSHTGCPPGEPNTR